MTLPTLTTYALPFALPFIDISLTFPTTLVLHLNINEDNDLDAADNDSKIEDAGLYSDDDEQDSYRTGKRRDTAESGELALDGEKSRKYVVTKWEEKGPLDRVLNSFGGIVNRLWVHISLCMTLQAEIVDTL